MEIMEIIGWVGTVISWILMLMGLLVLWSMLFPDHPLFREKEPEPEQNVSDWDGIDGMTSEEMEKALAVRPRMINNICGYIMSCEQGEDNWWQHRFRTPMGDTWLTSIEPLDNWVNMQVKFDALKIVYNEDQDVAGFIYRMEEDT